MVQQLKQLVLVFPACFGLFFGTLIGGSSPAVESIVIRLVDGKTGKVISGRVVRLSWQVPPHGYTTSMESTTAADGAASFQVKDPPTTLWVFPQLKGWTLCSDYKLSREQILRKGVVSDNKCDRTGKISRAFTAKSGEVVFFVTYGNLWEHIWGRLPRR